MNAEMIVTAVTSVLGLVQTVLPMISKNTAGTAAIGKVIDTIEAIAPLAVNQVGVVYQGFKNVTAAIGAHPATTAEQLASLKAFDKQVDDAWDAIEGQLDPDASPAAG